MTQSPSVLWRNLEHRITAQPDSVVISDLNLDRIFAEIVTPGGSAAVERLLRAPLLHSVDVEYRQEVFEDLSSPALRAQLESFSRSMSEIRRQISELPMVHHSTLRCRLHLDAMDAYCRNVTSLRQGLEGIVLDSRGLKAWRDYLNSYVTGADFEEFSSKCAEILAELDRIRYSMRIDDHRIVVDIGTDAPDYAAHLERLFEPFVRGRASTDQEIDPQSTSAHPVEERVLDELARLFPLPFRRMIEHTDSHPEFVDPVVDRVGDELQFYFSYFRLVDRLSASGTEFCLPEVTDSFDTIRVQAGFDLALAVQRIDHGEIPVANDYHLSGDERVIVVTGPNQGGKSTFARMFGQLAYLAALGCPVPARQAKLMLPDRIFTHFERSERSSDAAGGLESELASIKDTVDRATERTIIILNESFSSTATAEAEQIGKDVLRRISGRKSVATFVTFLDELSSLDGVVSMVAGIGEDPMLRTFRLERKPADGRAYAAALADQFGLSYAAIVGRMAR